MTKRWISLLALAAVIVSVIWTSTKSLDRPSPGEDSLIRSLGVSIAGPEFGAHDPAFSNQNPGVVGKHYIYPDAETITPLAEFGIKLMRLPVQWERFQPELGQDLNEDEIDRLDRTISLIGKAGGRVILDLHNYGRYRIAVDNVDNDSKVIDAVIDREIKGEVFVSRSHLADFWLRIAERYHDNPAIIAYGLMNEPHDMQGSRWDQISQTAVDAIRKVDRKTWILVSGNDWASSKRFPESNGAEAWIRDDTGRTAYEAHCYLDHDASGKYALSYDEELRLDAQLAKRSFDRLQPFAKWCEQNGVDGFIGEFGVPANDPNWNELLRQMLAEMHQFNLSGCCWAAGPWWDDYEMSVDITDPTSGTPQSLEVIVDAIERNAS